MNEHNQERLTTADLASAAERRDTDERERPVTTDRETSLPRDAVPADRRAAEAARSADEDRVMPLFAGDDANQLRERWAEIQTGFVDEPRAAVEKADGLVAETIKQLAENFAAERQRLEAQWDRGDDISTEDLRQSLRRYRSFFDRLLSV
jgi:hypothetical protein